MYSYYQGDNFFEVDQEGDLITISDRNKITIRNKSGITSSIVIPDARSIDFQRKILFSTYDVHHFILIYATLNGATTIHLFNKNKHKLLHSITYPQASATTLLQLKDHFIVGFRFQNAFLFTCDNGFLTCLKTDLFSEDLVQLEVLPNGNLLGLSGNGIVSLYDSTFNKLQETQSPGSKLFIGPWEKFYVVSIKDRKLWLNPYNMDDLAFNTAFYFDLTIEHKYTFNKTYDNEPVFKFYLLSNQYLVIIQCEEYSKVPVHLMNIAHSYFNYYISIFDLYSEKLLLKNKSLTSILKNKLLLNGVDTPENYLLFNTLEDGRLIALQKEQKEIDSFLDLKIIKEKNYTIFDGPLKINQREDVIKELNKVTLPPLAEIMTNYLGIFSPKKIVYKDIAVKKVNKNYGCVIS